MKEFEFSVDTVKELMDKMAKTHLGLLELEVGDVRLKLEAKQTAAAAVCAPQETAMTSVSAATLEADDSSSQEEGNEESSGTIVKSPIVGTFYAAPAPDKECFVKVGQSVKKGDVLFIIESMKLMNEIQSECDGVVSQIFVKSGDGVEFGQPIMLIQ